MALTSQQNKHSGGYWSIRLTRLEPQASHSAGDWAAVPHLDGGLRWGGQKAPEGTGESLWVEQGPQAQRVLIRNADDQASPYSPHSPKCPWGDGCSTRGWTRRLSQDSLGVTRKSVIKDSFCWCEKVRKIRGRGTEPETSSEFKMKHFGFVSGGLCNAGAMPLGVTMLRVFVQGPRQRIYRDAGL